MQPKSAGYLDSLSILDVKEPDYYLFQLGPCTIYVDKESGGGQNCLEFAVQTFKTLPSPVICIKVTSRKTFEIENVRYK